MKVIFGLGNKGKEFLNTRHNLGHWLINNLQKDFAIKDYINEKSLILAINEQFMNEAGLSSKKLLDEYKIPLDNFLVVHDDWDLPLGSYKLQKGKNSAGHKGVQSIIDTLRTKDFWRLRIGIGPGPKEGREEFVLGKITASEQKQLELIKPVMVETTKEWLSNLKTQMSNVKTISQN